MVWRPRFENGSATHLTTMFCLTRSPLCYYVTTVVQGFLKEMFLIWMSLIQSQTLHCFCTKCCGCQPVRTVAVKQCSTCYCNTSRGLSGCNMLKCHARIKDLTTCTSRVSV